MLNKVEVDKSRKKTFWNNVSYTTNYMTQSRQNEYLKRLSISCVRKNKKK